MTDEAARFTAEQTVMDANLEIRELKHLLVVKDDKIANLEAENAELKKQPKFEDINYGLDWASTPDVSSSEDKPRWFPPRKVESLKDKEEKSLQQKAVEASNRRSEIPTMDWQDAPLRSVPSEKYAEPEDKSQLNADDEEPNKESF